MCIVDRFSMIIAVSCNLWHSVNDIRPSANSGLYRCQLFFNIELVIQDIILIFSYWPIRNYWRFELYFEVVTQHELLNIIWLPQKEFISILNCLNAKGSYLIVNFEVFYYHFTTQSYADYTEFLLFSLTDFSWILLILLRGDCTISFNQPRLRIKHYVTFTAFVKSLSYELASYSLSMHQS
jgi:hypothetical protein